MNKHVTLFSTFLVLSLVMTACEPKLPDETPTMAASPTNDPVGEADIKSATETSAPLSTPKSTATPEPIVCTIVFDTDRDGNLEIYRMAPDGSNTINLTQNPADDWRPSWSPDGSQIAFSSNREYEGEGGQYIYVMDADGNNVRQLSPDNGSDWSNWSYDGSMIAYAYQDDIFIIVADGSGESINLTDSPEKESQPVWSPDGSQIAFLIGEEGQKDIAVMNADGSNMHKISDDGMVFSIAWTVDGRLFASWDNQEAGCHNCVLDPDGSNIIDAGGKGELQKYLPIWTLEGERAEVVEADALTGDSEILMILQSGSENILNLTQNPASDRYPDWPANCGP